MPESMDSTLSRLGDSLGNFQSAVSLVGSPKDWLDANINNVLEASRSLDLKLRQIDSIYPRFFVYTLAHAKLCAKKSPRTRKTILKLEANSDEIDHLAHHNIINDLLWDALNKCKCKHPNDSDARLRVEKLLELDKLYIAARILLILHDPTCRKKLVNQEGSSAQSLLDLFQGLLDSPGLDNRIRPPIVRAVVELSKKSGLHPQCLVLQGIHIHGPDPVAGGAFGDIWKGEVDAHAVAIKSIRAPDDIKTYCKEAVLWRQLSNPHVLPFLGVHHCPEKPLYVGLVSPWMDNGNVLQYLEKNPQADRKPLLLDVARGIHYLHSFEPPIVHGDLKGANVLITSSFRACVADFGLCTLVQDALVRFTPTKSAYSIGSMVYMAPELVLQENDQEGKPLPKSLASDMYSLGCTFYEMFVGRPQFCGMSYPQLLMAHIEHHRPPRPLITELDDLTWDLINWCCHEDPPARPRAYDVVQSLDSWRFPVEPDVPVCDWDEEIRARLRTALAINPCDGVSFAESANDTGGSEGCSTSSSPWSPISAASSSSTDISIMTSTGGYEMRPLTDQDIVIAIMGPTGTGKSSFINAAIRQACAIVGHDLESCTQKVVAFTCPHPDGSNRNIVFVDTPGFDDSKRTDYDILRDISKWLEQTYRQGITLTGILLFHRISESRMRGTPVKNLAVFEELCGKDALQNVVLTTTMWDEVSIEVGLEHEEQLKTQFWHPMISHGCRTARFESSSDSAWEIINQFDINNRRAVKLQTEVVDEGKKFSETSAYSVMVRWWKQFVEKVRELLDKPLWSPGEKAALRRELNVALRQQKAFDGGRRARPFEGLVTKVAMAYRTRRQTVARRGSSRSEDT